MHHQVAHIILNGHVVTLHCDCVDNASQVKMLFLDTTSTGCHKREKCKKSCPIIEWLMGVFPQRGIPRQKKGKIDFLCKTSVLHQTTYTQANSCTFSTYFCVCLCHHSKSSSLVVLFCVVDIFLWFSDKCKIIQAFILLPLCGRWGTLLQR